MKEIGHVMGWRDLAQPDKCSWRAAAIGWPAPIKKAIEIREDETPTLHHIERTRNAFVAIHGFWPQEVHIKSTTRNALEPEIREICKYRDAPTGQPPMLFDMRLVVTFLA